MLLNRHLRCARGRVWLRLSALLCRRCDLVSASCWLFVEGRSSCVTDRSAFRRRETRLHILRVYDTMFFFLVQRKPAVRALGPFDLKKFKERYVKTSGCG